MTFQSRAAKSQVRLQELLGEVQSRLEGIVESRSRSEELVTTILIRTAGLDLDRTLCVVAHAAAEMVDALDVGMRVYDDQLEASSCRDARYEDVCDGVRVEIRSVPGGYPGPSPVDDRPGPVRANMSIVRLGPVDRSVLEVPIRVRNQVFGNLSLTGKAGGGQFGDGDEAVIVVLAIAAGFAIDNALRAEQARMRRAWTAAAGDIATELLADIDIGVALRLIADTATSLSDPGHCLLIVPRDPGTSMPAVAELAVVDSIGSRRDDLDEALALLDAAVRTVFLERAPLRLAARDIEKASGPALFGSVVALPLRGIDSPLGVLVAVRPVGTPRFSDEQFDLMTVFADRVAAALRSVRARRQWELDELAERERLADELHDQMMQRLFAVREFLRDALPATAAPEALRLGGAIDELEHVVQWAWTAMVDGPPIDVAAARLDRAPAAGIAAAARVGGTRTPSPLVRAPIVTSAPVEHRAAGLGADASAAG
ncbi:GAF domain-containing protein [Nocardia sp. alder85J]|uniref:GAF domain-containing protein n=1 Tax=Nocardia sp. alder85J TaxID=2862949 RepID=UPI001CD50DC4|nr:GAF domain-containing protein [Nocardia sp. alder85J]MCX4093900.1 GAF domain-containing protein [Nocardia sp. alder85J]